MDIKAIKSEDDYAAALADIEGLMLAEVDTPEGDRLDVLATLVGAYEGQHFPMDLPDAFAAIEYSMERNTFDEEYGKTLLVMHDLTPSNDALDAAIASGATDGMPERLDQFDAFLGSLGASLEVV